MASDPTFYSTPLLQATVIPAATAYGGTRTAPTGLTTIFNGSTTQGHAIHRINVKSLGTTVAGLLELWLYDGTTHYELQGLTAPIYAVTGSTTVDPWRESIVYRDPLFIAARSPNAWELRAGVSVAQTSGLAVVVQGAST